MTAALFVMQQVLACLALLLSDQACSPGGFIWHSHGDEAEPPPIWSLMPIKGSSCTGLS